MAIDLVFGQPDDEGLSILGIVTNDAGVSLRDVKVTASIGVFHASGHTNEAGAYRVSGLREGDYWVSAEAPEYSRASVRNIPAGTENVNFSLLQKGGVAGQVVRADSGEPIQEFEVAHLNRVDEDFSSLRGSFEAVRDDNGMFELPGMEAGALTLFVKARGYVMGRAIIEELGGGESITGLVVRLETAVPISGIVVNEAGQPIPSAKIFTQHVRLDLVRTGQEKAEAITDMDGRFEVDTLVPDLQWVIVYHAEYAAGLASVPTTGRARDNLRIVLSGGGSLEGTLVPPDGTSTGQRMSVRAWYWDEQARGPIDITCEPDGTYSYDKLAVGSVELTAQMGLSIPGMGPSLSIRRRTIIEEGRSTMADFDFRAYDAAVEGMVLLGGDAAPGANVMVEYVASNGDVLGFFVWVDSEGNYSIDGVPGGTLDVRVRATSADGTPLWEQFTIETQAREVTRADFSF